VPMFSNTKVVALKKPGNSPKALYEVLLKALQTHFTL